MQTLSTNPLYRLAIAHLRASGFTIFPPAPMPGINMCYVPQRGASEARTVDHTVADGIAIVAYRTCSHSASCRLSTWARWITRTRVKRETKL